MNTSHPALSGKTPERVMSALLLTRSHRPCRATLSLLAALLSAWMVGCKPEAAATRQGLQVPSSCVADGDCDSDQLCLFRLCSKACASDANCADGSRCFDSGRGAACVRLQDNACIVSADCPARTQCMFGRCMSACEAGNGTQCPAGQTCIDGLCVGSLSAGASAVDMLGAAGGQAFLGSGSGGTPAMTSPAIPAADGGAAMQGAAGSSTPAGSGAMQSCATGSAHCEGADVVVCDAGGASHVEMHCPFLCVNGACSGGCAPGARRCQGQERQVCSATGTFTRLEACPTLCSPSACATGCQEGLVQCNGTALMRCTGGKFVQSQTCPFDCKDGACSGVCTPGATECSNGAVATCGADARWSAPITCPNVCTNGACAGVCRPGAQRCGGTSGFQVCSDAGQWGPTQACYNQACASGACTGVCTPSYTRCADEHSVVSCTADGQWGQAVTCSGQACSAGHCQGDCSPGVKRCKSGSNTQTELCSSAGAWQDGPDCSGRICSNGDCTGECSPGARRCEDGTAQRYQVCGDDAHWSVAQSCPNSGVCSGNGDCAAAPPPPPPTCTSGDSPDWYSPAQIGGNPSWNDPRWGSDGPVSFARSFAKQPGGYIAVFDRAAGELALTVRVTMGTAEAPDPSDSVRFGIVANRSGGPAARAATFALAELDVGEGPQQISTIATSDYSGSWQSSTPPNPWFLQTSLWRGKTGNEPSWVVSFRINLTDAGIDVSKPFRAALGVHIGNAPNDVSTPDGFSASMDAPDTWASVDLGAIDCVGRVSLSP
jgi:hypothetical protein